jgi:hypothetical protein
MITNIVLGLILVLMVVFTVGAAILAHEEKPYRYYISVTDEHDIL